MRMSLCECLCDSAHVCKRVRVHDRSVSVIAPPHPHSPTIIKGGGGGGAKWQGLCFCVSSCCPDYILEVVEPSVTKFGIMVHHHKLGCCVKNVFAMFMARSQSSHLAAFRSKSRSCVLKSNY